MSAQATSLQVVRELPPVSVQAPAADAGSPNPVAVQAATPSKKERIRKTLIAGAAVALLVTASWYGWDYWTVGRFQVSTDDAYVKADNTTIAPKVSGYLASVLVGRSEERRVGKEC